MQLLLSDNADTSRRSRPRTSIVDAAPANTANS
jgi:hypothetical protein